MADEIRSWERGCVHGSPIDLEFVSTEQRHQRVATYNLLWLWNILGILDLVSAIALGATSSPGPIQLFHVTPNSSLMTTLPWIIIPCFLVPPSPSSTSPSSTG